MIVVGNSLQILNYDKNTIIKYFFCYSIEIYKSQLELLAQYKLAGEEEQLLLSYYGMQFVENRNVESSFFNYYIARTSKSNLYTLFANKVKKEYKVQIEK